MSANEHKSLVIKFEEMHCAHSAICISLPFKKSGVRVETA